MAYLHHTSFGIGVLGVLVIVLGVAAVAAWFRLPSLFLIYFTAACALVLCAAGFWYGRVGRQHRPDS